MASLASIIAPAAGARLHHSHSQPGYA